MKTGFTVACILFAIFVMFFATFNICVTHTEKKIELVNNKMYHIERKCDSLETVFIDYQIKNNKPDTIVLNILSQPVNLKYNIKKN